jgi:hypothetical protein
MPEPITDEPDQTTETPSGKKVVLPPSPGKSSPMYDAEPEKDDSSPYTTDFLKRFDPDSNKALNNTLSGLERQRGDAEQHEFGSLNRKMAEDRAQMEKAYHAESASADAIPPAWNADKEQRERVRTPIEDFGSIGAIFGILASQFTKTPLTSAMNAAAAAMNATREHDEEGYKTAYEAWKDNTNLALKRFGMEREMFEDANKLISTDLASWKVKQLAIASQFDNKKAIAMLDAGMNGELLDMQEKSIVAADKLQKVMEDQKTIDDRRQVLSAGMKQFDKDHPDANPYERAMARLELTRATALGKNQWQVEELNRFRSDYFMANGHEPSDKEVSAHLSSIVRRPSAVSGGAPTKQKEIQRRMDVFKKEHPDATLDEVDAEYDRVSRDIANASQPTMTPNKRIDVESSITQYKESLTKIDETTKILETHVGAAGLAGKATRMGERVGNIFGNNATDREQFMRDIQFLRSAAQKLLFDRAGRPIAADADRINDIIGGLSLGDTTANTLRSLREVKTVLERLQKSKQDQLGGVWKSDAAPGKPGDTPGATKPAWEEAPIVGQ